MMMPLRTAHAVVLLGVALAALWERSSAACVMTQTCVNVNNTLDDACIPEAHKTPAPPAPMTGPGWANVTGGGACSSDADCHNKGKCVGDKCVCKHDGMTAGAHCNEYAIQCPEYAESACCSWQQNQGMAQNFMMLASVFGNNGGGGCDACAANLMALWCGLVCSPRQSEFMNMHLPYPSINNRSDPMTGADHVKVLEMDVSLQKAFTCSLFDSCKNTAIASMTEAMKSSLGFLGYQAQTGAIGHGEYFHLHFESNASTAFEHSVLACTNYSEAATIKPILPTQAQLLPSIASPNATKQCPCGACRATCDAHKDDQGSNKIKVVDNPISVFDGFNSVLVAIVYGALGVMLAVARWRQSQ
ncbi:TPA: hypothetical protein N0F65_006913 [Lagenidium giganteum]|uniref:Niemann-Pick C1 N-terminal domain-containing protein n=1 Tax=Lagenidium giganteum TaxID=4803 RepID=A0AAV2ZFL8_9STRA|nr:TPA: hypothetical protein N0F65_006913 [Lagenidium giganteum]